MFYPKFLWKQSQGQKVLCSFIRKCNAEEQKWGKMDHSKEEVKANLRGHYWAGEHLVSGYHGIIFWGGHEKYWKRIYFYFLLEMFGGIKSPEVLSWASFLPSFFSFQLSIHPSIHLTQFCSAHSMSLVQWIQLYNCCYKDNSSSSQKIQYYLYVGLPTSHFST